MRRIILLSSILLLPAMWTMAQSVSSSGGENQTDSRTTTVVGCMDGAVGNYTLTDHRTGAEYRLTGNTEQLKSLKSNVLETMRVTGVFTPVVNLPYSVGEGTENEPTLSIVSIQRVSGVCSDEEDLP
jgi:hypothetical protein